MGHILPTTLEFGFASGILFYCCGWPYLLTMGSTVAAYTVFTYQYSMKRQKII